MQLPSSVLTTKLISMPNTPRHLSTQGFQGPKWAGGAPALSSGHRTLPRPRPLAKAKPNCLSLHSCQTGVSVPGQKPGTTHCFFSYSWDLAPGSPGGSSCVRKKPKAPVTQRSPLRNVTGKGEKAMYKRLPTLDRNTVPSGPLSSSFYTRENGGSEGSALPKVAHGPGTEAEPCALSFCPSP